MSISKNELRQVRALSQKKFRDETGLFVVEGEKMVSEALASGFEVVSVYRRDEIGAEAMDRLSMLSSPSPVLAVVRQPASVAFRPAKGLFLALDGIRDPGNRRRHCRSSKRPRHCPGRRWQSCACTRWFRRGCRSR